MIKQEEIEMETVLENIFDSIKDEEKIKARMYLSNKDNAVLFDKIFKDGSINIEQYHLHFVTPQKRLSNGILKTKGIKSHQAIFLLNNLSFVKAHLESLIVEKEGCNECEEKSRRLVKMYFNYFEYNMPFIVRVLPKNVLKTEQEALDYFNAIYSLFHGQSKKYIEFLSR